MGRIAILALGLVIGACGGGSGSFEANSQPEAILIITVDTTRADRLGHTFDGVKTPHMDALAAQGLRFDRAYATVPMTLPSHTSIFTGLLPSKHGVRENARLLRSGLPLLAPQMKEAGFQTAAFVSSFVLDRQFGLDRGFDVYDDAMDQNGIERSATKVTDAALKWLDSAGERPLFLWVHYFDPHHPYAPPEPFASQYKEDLYSGEIAYMDQQIGRLLAAFRSISGERSHRIILTGDHGESLGEHGEAYHGNLVYEGPMHVPLLLAGTDIKTEIVSQPVSNRLIQPTVLKWLGHNVEAHLHDPPKGVVMGEAMKPYLQYGWSPQVMAIEDDLKVIRSGELEVFDLAADPKESQNLSVSQKLSPDMGLALENYALPDAEQAASGLSAEDMEQLASLGYTAGSGLTQKTGPLPNPKDMTALFPMLDEGSDLFVQERYASAVEVFDRVLEKDPDNLMVLVRQAVSHSLLGNEQNALDYFRKAGDLNPDSPDLRHYIGMHFLRFKQEDRAAEHFEYVLSKTSKTEAVLALARIRENQGKIGTAAELFYRAASVQNKPELFAKSGQMAMAVRDERLAIQAFEDLRNRHPKINTHYLDLALMYMARERFQEAADLLDLIPANHRDYPAALYKRAQAAVLLRQPDAPQRVQTALGAADRETRELMLQDPLIAPFLR